MLINFALSIQLLQSLCSFSASEDGSARRNAIQSDTSLLTDSVYLLKTVQKLGSKVESFRPVKKLSDVRGTEAEANPVFGFKRDLVRLIGNMCWRHKKNQDMVSEYKIF